MGLILFWIAPQVATIGTVSRFFFFSTSMLASLFSVRACHFLLPLPLKHSSTHSSRPLQSAHVVICALSVDRLLLVKHNKYNSA